MLCGSRSGEPSRRPTRVISVGRVWRRRNCGFRCPETGVTMLGMLAGGVQVHTTGRPDELRCGGDTNLQRALACDRPQSYGACGSRRIEA
jgi:hypothetical protein